MMGVTVTWLVSAFLLGDFDMGASMRTAILLVHTIVPVATILDWLLFDEKGRLQLASPLLWTIFPLAYFVYAMIASRIGGGIGYDGSRYPYPFIDADILGMGRVLVNVALLTIFFVALGYAFVLVDRLLCRAGGIGAARVERRAVNETPIARFRALAAQPIFVRARRGKEGENAFMRRRSSIWPAGAFGAWRVWSRSPACSTRRRYANGSCEVTRTTSAGKTGFRETVRVRTPRTP